jgi:hypothetical protein
VVVAWFQVLSRNLLEEYRKTTWNLSQNSRSLCRGLNSRPSEYKARVTFDCDVRFQSSLIF